MGAAAAGADEEKDVRWLLGCLKEDLIANRGTWGGAGFQAIAVHRLGDWARDQNGLTRRLVTPLYRLLFSFVRNVYSIDLPRSVSIGRRPRITHPAGIVISYQAEIGDDCVIRQNVTVGMFNRGRRRAPPYAPRLGNGVEVGAGAVIVGGISVGDGARIGPNAVVMTDVPAGGSAFANPAKVMQPLHPADAVPSGSARTIAEER